MIVFLALFLQEDSNELRWKLAAGELLRYHHTVEQKFEMQSGGAPFAYTQKIEATERLEVERTTAEGNFEIQYLLERLTVSVDGRTVYDSADPKNADPATAALFGGPVGEARRFVLTPRGKIAGSAPQTLDRFQRSFSNVESASSKGEAYPLAILAVPFPEEAGKANWELEETADAGYGVRVLSKSKYALGEKVGSDRKIVATTELVLKDPPESVRLTEQTGRQESSFDVQSGALKESRMDLTVTLERTMKGKTLKCVNRMTATTKLAERKKK